MISLHRFSSVLAIGIIFASLVACTPEYARRQGEELAGQARLLDSVNIERSNERLFSRHSQICLVSADGGAERGAEMLRTMQAGFSGYFLAASVVGESIDYLRAVSNPPCPGATYLFYVQPAQDAACGIDCESAQFVFTVISIHDQSLVDRIRFSVKKSLLPPSSSERERKQKAFEQLAIVLTGGE